MFLFEKSEVKIFFVPIESQNNGNSNRTLVFSEEKCLLEPQKKISKPGSLKTLKTCSTGPQLYGKSHIKQNGCVSAENEQFKVVVLVGNRPKNHRAQERKAYVLNIFEHSLYNSTIPIPLRSRARWFFGRFSNQHHNFLLLVLRAHATVLLNF